MKIYLFFISSLFLLSSCFNSKSQTAVQDNCKNLPKLRWQNESISRNDTAFKKFTTDLIAAAKNDALLSYKIEGTTNIKFQSQLSKTLSSITDSKVSSEFWEADIAFRQTICYLESTIKDKSTSPELRKFLEVQFQELLKSRNEYVQNLQKKTSALK